MRRDKIVLISTIVLVLLLLAGSVGYAVWKVNSKKEPVASSPYELSKAESDSDSSVLSVSNEGGIPLNAGSGEGIGLQTDLGSQNSNKTDKNSFSEYAKYKDEKNALIGEIKAGEGPVAEKGKKVALLYKGWLTNGTLIDESKPSQAGGKIVPLIFQIGGGQVIAGMEQGVYGMKEGGKRRIIIPPAVGYGNHGYSSIPANSVLIFDVELVSVQ